MKMIPTKIAYEFSLPQAPRAKFDGQNRNVGSGDLKIFALLSSVIFPYLMNCKFTRHNIRKIQTVSCIDLFYLRACFNEK